MAENLKKTILIENEEYNINAVYSDEAGKVTQSLTVKESDEVKGIFDGSIAADRVNEINYVPATGGTFVGPVSIDSNLNELSEEALNKTIINYEQITSKIANLTGAPLYTLNDNYQIYSVTDHNKTDYKLNTLVGTSQGLEPLKRILANPNGSEGIIYDCPANYTTCTVTGLENTFNADVVIPATYTKTLADGTSKTWKVTKIGNGATDYNKGGAFYKTDITSVVLPDSIETIEKWTFVDCKKLVSINIPDKVSTIANATFTGCTSLKNVKLGKSLKTISGGAFSQCESLENIVIPDGVTKLDALVFNGCTKLASVVIPKSVTTIGEQVFDVVPENNPVPLTIYYTGTAEEWAALMNKTTSLNVRLKAATVVYDYRISNVIPSYGDLIDFKEFSNNPIIYICKDAETTNSPVSNKIFLKLPGSTADFIEISKGAARLESPTEATTKGYYTYETLAAIIAGINSRLTALGSTALALPETLRVSSAEHVIVPEIPDEIIATNNNVLVEETSAPAVQQLQEQITKITGGTYTDKKVVPLNFSDAYEMGYDFSGKTITFTRVNGNSSGCNYTIIFSSGSTISGSVFSGSHGQQDGSVIISGETEPTTVVSSFSTDNTRSVRLPDNFGKITELQLGSSSTVKVTKEEFNTNAGLQFSIAEERSVDYKDTVLKAKADETGRNISTGYYRSANTSVTNTITIATSVPTTEPGNIGDIRIVI